MARCRGRAGFSLVEVALALGITAFVSTCIMGMIILGVTTFKRAMDNTVRSAIVQNLTNEIFLTEFRELRRMAKSRSAIYYFDVDGTRLTTPDGAIYTAEITFTDLSDEAGGNALNGLSPGAGTTALITITKVDKTVDRHFVMVGNNQQVSATTAPATW
ncbi:hypothetical protein DB346_01560 [Verrucomicrobia bacterium LW23]|nr:hypothetical protein DB346_01560 [Verrucomicrobia bacterium LW23]